MKPVCKSQKDQRKEKQMREREKWEFNMQREEQRDRERVTDKEEEEQEWLEVMFLKCHPSIQLHNSQNSTNGL